MYVETGALHHLYHLGTRQRMGIKGKCNGPAGLEGPMASGQCFLEPLTKGGNSPSCLGGMLYAIGQIHQNQMTAFLACHPVRFPGIPQEKPEDSALSLAVAFHITGKGIPYLRGILPLAQSGVGAPPFMLHIMVLQIPEKIRVRLSHSLGIYIHADSMMSALKGTK